MNQNTLSFESDKRFESNSHVKKRFVFFNRSKKKYEKYLQIFYSIYKKYISTIACGTISN